MPAMSIIHTRMTLPREDSEDDHQSDSDLIKVDTKLPVLTVERLAKDRMK